MNHIPPNLSYLTIYNPTLQPSGPIEDDNEDAEEQAHILFYTSKERAVSRDRMLRQIGLAKALINYVELFDADSPCENVHSQSRRMIMVSPEPGFWIHAGIDIAKVPRVVDQKNKSKSKGKQVDREKEKEKQNDPGFAYDYQDGSVHDGALRAHILKGYEQFKLTHGSFTTVLSTLGQQALELQLERFWTVWAWSWDLEQPPDFEEEFGPRLHPHSSSLIPIIDEFARNLLNDVPVILTRTYIIPSSRYSAGHYPAALFAHFSSIIPPKMDVSHSSDTLNTLASSVDTIKGKYPSRTNTKGSSSTSQHDGTMNFLSMPTINMKMDMQKWKWPDYLTLGKASVSKSISDISGGMAEQKKQDALATQVEVEVNADELADAISSHSLSTTTNDKDGLVDSASTSLAAHDTNDVDSSIFDGPSLKTTYSIPSSPSSSTLDQPETTTPPSPPLVELSMTKVHLSSSENPSITTRVSIKYAIRNEIMLVLIGLTDDKDESRPQNEVADLNIITESASGLFDSIEYMLQDGDLTSMSDSLPSATKILQAQDRYMISTGHYIQGNPGFTTVSSHLFNAKAILDQDPEIMEVFSRGQNPQHWHIAKRGLGGPTTDSETVTTEGAAFMEVFRKETSLTDVDNVLIGLVKKSGLADGTPGSR